jgi:hypothetical protein
VQRWGRGFDGVDPARALRGSGNSETGGLARRNPPFLTFDIASPTGAAGLCSGRYGSTQCSAWILGQRACQNGAAAEESANVIRRPETINRAPALSTRSRRLQPVLVAFAMVRRVM